MCVYVCIIDTFWYSYVYDIYVEYVEYMSVSEELP